jgi:NADH dehydrogenase FAD-containing subunit
MGRTALVLGAGVGGIVAARTLRRLLPATDRVVAVERERSFVFTPSLLWHITASVSPGASRGRWRRWRPRASSW